MKKFISVLLSLISVIIIAFAFTACGDEAKPNGKLEAGKFYTVTEAYENGYLTRGQVMSIVYYHNGGIEYNEGIMSEDYLPLPKTPEKLNEEIEEALKTAYYNWQHLENRYTIDDVGYRYLGTYGNVVAVIINADNAVGDAEYEEIIDGITIWCSVYIGPLIWIKD